MDTDSFVLNVNTTDIFKDLKILEELFDLINSNENHEYFSNKNENVIGKLKIETPKIIWIDGFVCLRSKMYAFKCCDVDKNKLKGFSKSQSENFKFEECYNCLFGGKYKQDCDKYLIRSFNHEMFLQRVRKSTLSQFVDKRCYIYIKLKVNLGISIIKWL